MTWINKNKQHFILLVLIIIIITANSGCVSQNKSKGVSAPLQTTNKTQPTNTLTPFPPFPPSPSSTSLAKTPAEILTSTDQVPELTSKLVPSDISELTILAVGDNLIHDQVIASGKNNDGSYNYDHLFINLKEDIEDADISIINQETISGGNDFSYTGYPNFNSPTEIGDAVINAGFDVVLHATNHSMDKGYSAIKNTLNYWSKHPSITVLGLNNTLKEQNKITIITKNGIKVAMLNYTYGLNGYKLPSDKPYLVNLLDKPKVTKDIKKAKQLADYVIVFPHWGTEYVYEPDSYQKEWTNFFAKQGVDLVIGTHPHVIEPVEWIETESGHRMLVYYSLGNYVSYQREAPRMLGGMATITLIKNNSEVSIRDNSIIPIVTHYENHDKYNYGVYKLTEYKKEQALKHGVLELEQNSLFSFNGTFELARQIVGDWIYCPKKSTPSTKSKSFKQ